MAGPGDPPLLGWLGILRLGLVQTALGAVVVLTTSAINRVMVVELALAATVPGLLVGLHYAMQLLRPRMGHGSDVGGRRTPWIIGGTAVLALGGTGAAVSVAVVEAAGLAAGLAVAALAFLLIGAGIASAGTSLLVLLAARVAPERRAAAASLVWIMMIAGFVVTTAVASRLLDPYSPFRLVAVSAGVCILAFLLASAAVWGVEPRRRPVPEAAAAEPAPAAAGRPAFKDALRQVWAEPDARRFAVFVFVSMLAYSAQDLVVEPYGGAVFALTLGETTRLASVQHAGVLMGMVAVALLGSARARGDRAGRLRRLTVGGCIGAGLAVLCLGALGMLGEARPLAAICFMVGLGDGVFVAAAIALMMNLAGRDGEERAGLRMGVWGAAQAIAFGLGGLVGTAAVDAARYALGAPSPAYALVFAADALLFLWSARLAVRIGSAAAAGDEPAHSAARRLGTRPA
ncbi:MAG TPA: BCD family MFS transporter [Acetobacteraceae bacterium]|nr:BCD family MFS transporter [Acetobacteraceae bacterium]